MVSMRPCASKGLVLLFACLALAMFAIASIGAFHAYSPLPFWDSWVGSLAFFMQAQDGDLSAWIAFHNEHPMWFAKALFWLDFRFLDGLQILQFAVNIALLLLISLFPLKFLLMEANAELGTRTKWAIGLLLMAWLLQWSQYENVTWEFTSANFLVEILPISSFFLISSHLDGKGGAWRLYAAGLAGLAAEGTMANGIFTLPLCIAWLYLANAPKRDIARLGILLFLAVLLFLAGSGHLWGDAPASRFIASSPFQYARFFLTCLGLPILPLLPAGVAPYTPCLVAGSIFLLLSFLAMGRLVSQRTAVGADALLLCTLTYIVLTAAVTTFGRTQLGIDQAFASRYHTPMLLGWATLALLFRVALERLWLHGWPVQLLAILLLAVGSWTIVKKQRVALHPYWPTHHARTLAALALELHIQDDERTLALYPHAPTLHAVADKAMVRGLGFFGQPASVARQQLVGSPVLGLMLVPCEGKLTSVVALAQHPEVYLLRGWTRSTPDVPTVRHLTVKSGDVVQGYAVTGALSSDARAALGSASAYGGFAGYIKSLSQPTQLTIVDTARQCSMSWHGGN